MKTDERKDFDSIWEKLLTGYDGIISEDPMVLPRSWRRLPGRAEAWAEVKGVEDRHPGLVSTNQVIGGLQETANSLVLPHGNWWKEAENKWRARPGHETLWRRTRRLDLIFEIIWQMGSVFQMGSGEARFVFWNGCSSGQIWSGEIRKQRSERGGHCKSLTDGGWGLGLGHVQEGKEGL